MPPNEPANLEAKLAALQAAMRMIIDLTDAEMRDGDTAREIATRAIEQDPEYEWRPAIPKLGPQPKGIQCGQCGMKFEYGKAYGFCCQHLRCPCGYGPSMSMAGDYP